MKLVSKSPLITVALGLALFASPTSAAKAATKCASGLTNEKVASPVSTTSSVPVMTPVRVATTTPSPQQPRAPATPASTESTPAMALAPEVESASVVTPAPEQDNGETTEQANNAYGGMDDDNDDEAETTNSDVIPAPVEDADTTEQSNSAYGDADDNNDDGDDGETEETEEIGSDYDLPSDNEPEQGGDVASDADTEPVQTTTTPAQDVTVTPATDSSVQTNGDDVDPVTCLAAHNKVRAAVGVPALTWDASLAAKGVSWAQHMEDLNFFDHNTPGQDDSQMNNLYSGTSCLDAVAAFESEKSMFPADHIVREENYIDYGHYSMMVWRTTTRVGCGRGATKNLVCYYEEPGNVVGEAAY